jgi:hypothetical protein
VRHGWAPRRRTDRTAGESRDAARRETASEVENTRTAWRYWGEEQHLEQRSKLGESVWLLYDARGWDPATVGLTNALLHVLAATPSTPERAEQEILLPSSLARVLMATRGDPEEGEQAYTRPLKLCETTGDIPP